MHSMTMTENKLKRALFIDRDGTIIVEPPVDFQVDSLEKLEFVPRVMHNLNFIKSHLDYELVMVTNQDGLGTEAFPTEDFEVPHNKMLRTLEGEGIVFDDIVIDKTFEHENAPTRKPGTALLGRYTSGEYNLAESYVIGDRITDVLLARNLGAKAILISDEDSGKEKIAEKGLEDVCALITQSWDRISDFLRGGARVAQVKRTTSETDIDITIDLDGTGACDISTGLGFFDHMLCQIGKLHRRIELNLTVIYHVQQFRNKFCQSDISLNLTTAITRCFTDHICRF